MKKLIIGEKYNGYTYEGLDEGDYPCDVCGKSHYTSSKLPKLHWFTKEDEAIKVGTSCISKDNFYTRLLGIVN